MELYEISTLPSYRLKARSPLLYWLGILLISYIVVHLSLVLVDDVKADIEIFDIQSGADDLPYTPGDDPHVAICPSGRFYFPFIDSDGDFVVAWSDDNRSSWDEVNVQSDGWKGETFMMVQSVQSWVNNTTVISIRTIDADRGYDLYLFWIWGENEPSDPAAWNYTQINGVGISLCKHLSMVFNRTGMLHIVWNQANAIRHRLWDITTGDFDTSDAIWKSINGNPMIQCDYNNNVWIGYQTSSWYYIEDWDDTESLQITADTNRHQFGAFFIASDNKKILTGHRQYLSNHAVLIAYETTVNTTMTYNTFQADVDDWSTTFWTTGNVVGTQVSICLLRLETGSDEYVKYEANYDAVDAVWEGSEMVLWTIPSDADDARHFGTGPNSIWPKIDGTSVCMATGGVMYYWMFKDELGATDDYYEIVYSYNATFPSFDWEPPEEPGGNGNETASMWPLWYTGENCRSWAVALFVLVVVIGIIGVAGRNL